jgi:hypothetical protein
VKTKVPEDLTGIPAGKLADLLYKLRAERGEIEGKAEEVKAEETRIKDFLIETMPKAELSRITGELANAALTRKVVPQVADWDKLYAFIEKNDAFDLLQKRPSELAFKERWEAGVQVPGVDQFTVLGISVTKKGK